jgi:hypothetical protein
VKKLEAKKAIKIPEIFKESVKINIAKITKTIFKICREVSKKTGNLKSFLAINKFPKKPLKDSDIINKQEKSKG